MANASCYVYMEAENHGNLLQNCGKIAVNLPQFTTSLTGTLAFVSLGTLVCHPWPVFTVVTMIFYSR